MIKSVVTGGCGFIGSHVADRLLAEKHEVTVIDNLTTGRLENVEHIKDYPGLKIINADIRDYDRIKPYFDGADYVFHLAALADIVPSIQNPRDYFTANVDGTFNVLECVKNTHTLKKLVYAASSSCYGIPDAYPTKEEAAARPEYPYALTKRLGEELALHWAKLYKVPVISLRLFNVYGPRSRTGGTYGAVFGVFLAQKLAGQAYTVVGDGTQTRDFTYVTDVADAFYTAALSEITNEIFNVGSGGTYSVNQLIELLGGDKIYIPKRPGEPDCTFADVTKIKSLLGWSAKISLREGVAKVLENIDYWEKAPVWTPEKIGEATKDWFKYLGKQE
ncbi:MAG: SDR family oxidoreductase [Syntrophomonadaceae bacterium]|jgi:UDP-glucose 4-epimerase|nr:SDR family oxidoreductase [Syntrophomonadaceae bacterium]